MPTSERLKTASKLLRTAGFSPYMMLRGMPGVAKRLTVLMYHSVDPEPAPFSITPSSFEKQIAFLKDNYKICRLREADQFLSDTHDREKRLVVTFDDAYENFEQYALPVLGRFDVPCTVFVPTAYMGKWNTWDAGQDTLPRRKLLTAERLQALAKSPAIELGSHAVDHLGMRDLPRCEMETQAAESKRQLEQLTGSPVESFCYPYGTLDHFSKETTEVLIAAGYRRGITSRWGTLNSYADRMVLRRIWFEEDDQPSDLQAKICGDYDWFAAKERIGRTVRTIVRSVRPRERRAIH